MSMQRRDFLKTIGAASTSRSAVGEGMAGTHVAHTARKAVYWPGLVADLLIGSPWVTPVVSPRHLSGAPAASSPRDNFLALMALSDRLGQVSSRP